MASGTTKNSAKLDAVENFYQNMRACNASRYPDFNPETMALWLTMIRTFGVCENRMARRIQAYGVTLSGLNALAVLRESPEGMPLNQISRLLLVSPANMTGLIDSLVKKKYVERIDHRSDRRISLAKITQAGLAWLDSYLPGHYRAIGEMLQALSASDKKRLATLFRKWRQALLQKAAEVHS